MQVLDKSHWVGSESYHSALTHLGSAVHLLLHSTALFTTPNFDSKRSFWAGQYLPGIGVYVAPSREVLVALVLVVVVVVVGVVVVLPVTGRYEYCM